MEQDLGDYPLVPLGSQRGNILHYAAQKANAEAMVYTILLYHSLHGGRGLPDKHVSQRNAEGMTPFQVLYRTHFQGQSSPSPRAVYCALLLRTLGADAGPLDAMVAGYVQQIRMSLPDSQQAAMDQLRAVGEQMRQSGTAAANQVQQAAQSKTSGWKDSFDQALQSSRDKIQQALHLGQGQQMPAMRIAQNGGYPSADAEAEERYTELMRHVGHGRQMGAGDYSQRAPKMDWSARLRGGGMMDWTREEDDDLDGEGRYDDQMGGAHHDEIDELLDEMDDEELSDLMGGRGDDDDGSGSDDDDDEDWNTGYGGVNLRPEMSRGTPENDKAYRDLINQIMDEMGVKEEEAAAIRTIIRRHVIKEHPELKSYEADGKRIEAIRKYISKSKINKLIKDGKYDVKKVVEEVRQAKAASAERRQQRTPTSKPPAKKPPPKKTPEKPVMARGRADDDWNREYGDDGTDDDTDDDLDDEDFPITPYRPHRR